MAEGQRVRGWESKRAGLQGTGCRNKGGVPTERKEAADHPHRCLGRPAARRVQEPTSSILLLLVSKSVQTDCPGVGWKFKYYSGTLIIPESDFKAYGST